MQRRDFLAKSSVVGAWLLAAKVGQAQEYTSKRTFQQKYAPHLGMFKHSAGKEFISQLNFAADQGFMAWEDNGMKGRDVETQKKVASTMSDAESRWVCSSLARLIGRTQL